MKRHVVSRKAWGELNYVIYYTPTDRGVLIGHVVHGAMGRDVLFRQWFLSGE
jgi:hypothetical protein